MAKLALICHRCQHRYRAKAMDECPKCGSTMVGPTRGKGGILGLLILVMGGLLAGAYYYLGKTPQDLVEDAQQVIPQGLEAVKGEDAQSGK